MPLPEGSDNTNKAIEQLKNRIITPIVEYFEEYLFKAIDKLYNDPSGLFNFAILSLTNSLLDFLVILEKGYDKTKTNLNEKRLNGKAKYIKPFIEDKIPEFKEPIINEKFKIFLDVQKNETNHLNKIIDSYIYDNPNLTIGDLFFDAFRNGLAHTFFSKGKYRCGVDHPNNVFNLPIKTENNTNITKTNGNLNIILSPYTLFERLKIVFYQDIAEMRDNSKQFYNKYWENLCDFFWFELGIKI